MDNHTFHFPLVSGGWDLQLTHAIYWSVSAYQGKDLSFQHLRVLHGLDVQPHEEESNLVSIHPISISLPN